MTPPTHLHDVAARALGRVQVPAYADHEVDDAANGCAGVCVCMCVCAREREGVCALGVRERERERERECV